MTILLMVMFLVACGGGVQSGDKDDKEPNATPAPTNVSIDGAGSVIAGQSIQLSGNADIDDGLTLKTQWKIGDAEFEYQDQSSLTLATETSQAGTSISIIFRAQSISGDNASDWATATATINILDDDNIVGPPDPQGDFDITGPDTLSSDLSSIILTANSGDTLVWTASAPNIVDWSNTNISTLTVRRHANFVTETTVTITATTRGDNPQSGSKTIRVQPITTTTPNPTDIIIDGPTTMTQDDLSIELTSQVLPESASQSVVWTSDSDAVSIVAVAGKVAITRAGNIQELTTVVLTATATTGSNIQSTHTIEIHPTQQQGITLSGLDVLDSHLSAVIIYPQLVNIDLDINSIQWSIQDDQQSSVRIKSNYAVSGSKKLERYANLGIGDYNATVVATVQVDDQTLTATKTILVQDLTTQDSTQLSITLSQDGSDSIDMNREYSVQVLSSGTIDSWSIKTWNFYIDDDYLSSGDYTTISRTNTSINIIVKKSKLARFATLKVSGYIGDRDLNDIFQDGTILNHTISQKIIDAKTQVIDGHVVESERSDLTLNANNTKSVVTTYLLNVDTLQHSDDKFELTILTSEDKYSEFVDIQFDGNTLTASLITKPSSMLVVSMTLQSTTYPDFKIDPINIIALHF